MNKISKFSTRQLTGIAILGALSSILFLFEIPIVLFYKLDFSNLPVLLGTFAYGPLSGTFILLIKNLTGLLHTTSGGVGQLADFLNGIVFVLIA
ncbi:MAG: ECF transporter S component, partial [Christensenellaceae bacterium]|nr:ECF transporter S component [Christensenellaceae bacterium]